MSKRTHTPIKRVVKDNNAYYVGGVLPRKVIAGSSTLILFIVLLVLPIIRNNHANALSLTWDGGGADNNWSTCANWSSDTCPGSGDTVTFNNTSTKDSVIDVGFGGVITTLTTQSTYTGAITMSRSLQVTSTVSLSSTSFNVGSQTLDVDGAFSLLAGTFTASSNTMTFASTFTISGSPIFNANGGTVTFDGTGTATLTCNSVTFNLVQFAHTAGTKTVSSNCSFPMGANPITGTGGSITVAGTLSGSGTLTTGASGTASALTMSSTGSLSGFTGLVTNGNLTINGATMNLGSYTTVDINSAFGLTTSAVFTAPSGTMTVAGSFSVVSGTTFNANGGTLTFDTTTGTISCNNTVFNLVTFGSTGFTKTVSSDCNLPLGNNPTIPTAVTLSGTLTGTGTINHTTATLQLNSGAALSGFTGLTGNILLINGGTWNFGAYSPFSFVSNVTVQASAITTFPNNTDINGTFLLQTSATLNAPSGSMYLGSTSTFNSGTTFSHNNGTVVFDGNNSGVITCNNAVFNLVAFQNTSGTKTVSSGCTLPLGANPSLIGLILNGTLSGSGTLNIYQGTFTINSTGLLSGFTGFSGIALTITGATADFSSYTTFTTTSTVTIQTSANVTLPSNADINSPFTLSTSSTLNMPNGSVFFSGTFTLNSGTTFNANSGTVVFDGTASANITCNNATFHSVLFSHTGGTKTIVNGCNLPLGNNPTVGVGTSAAIVLNGTFSGTGTITVNGSFQLNTGTLLSGFSRIYAQTLIVNGPTFDFSTYTDITTEGSVTISNSSVITAPPTMHIGRNLTINSGTTFNHNNGTIIFTESPTLLAGTLACNNVAFYSVQFTHTSTIKTINSDCNLPLGNNPTVGQGGTITLNGILSGTGTLNIPGTVGSSSLTLNSGSVLSGFSGLTMIGGLKVSGVTSDFTSYTTFDIGALNLQSAAVFIAPVGVMKITGSFIINSGTTFSHNNGTVEFNGTDNQGPSGSSCASFSFHKVVINKTAGDFTVYPGCTIPLGENPTATVSDQNKIIVIGTLSGSGKLTTLGTLDFIGTGLLSGFSSLETNDMRVVNSLNLGSYSEVKIGGDLTLIKPGSLTAPSGSMYIAGNFTNVSDDGSLRFGGVTGDMAYTTDAAAISISGDIDIRVKVALDDWTPATPQYLLNKWDFSTNNAYSLYINTDGTIHLRASTTGGNTIDSASTVATNLGDGSIKWIRATRVATTGATDFYMSDDGSSWSALGTTVANTSGSIFDSNVNLVIGGANAGQTNPPIGNFYRVQILNGIGGSIAYDANFTAQSINTTQFTEGSSNAATVNISGSSAYITGSGSATFNSNKGTVVLNGGDQQLSGDFTFYNLTKEVTTNSTLTLPAGRTITIEGLLRLKGKGSQYLSLVSSSPGSQWYINRKGTSYMSKLAVKDSKHINNTLIACYSIDNGNNYGWAFNTDACYSTASTDATDEASVSSGDDSILTPTNISKDDTRPTDATKPPGTNNRAWKVGLSLSIAAGGLWWLIALMKRRHGEPNSW